MAALKKLLIGMVLLAGLIAALPLVIPYNNLRPGIEAAMSRRLDIPVDIADISFSYAPVPQLVLSQVKLGKAGEASIGQVVIPATLRNLFSFTRELSEVSLEDAQLKQDFAISLPHRLKADPGRKDVHLDTMTFNKAVVQLRKGVFGPISGSLKLNADGTFKDITITDAEKRASLSIRPLNEKFALEFIARNWVLPARLQARFEQLVVRGMADREGVLIDEISAVAYGGTAIGQAQLSWTDGWKLNGSIDTKGMQAEPLQLMFSEITRATGRAAATTRIAFAGEDYESLFKQPQIESQFIISDGNLHNLDLITPLKSQNPSSLQRGGQTRFDSLAGLMVFNGNSVVFRNLALSGGKFSANGSIAIDAERNLRGQLNTRITAGAIVVGAPLTIQGKLDAPEIQSSGAFKPGSDASTTQVF